MRPASAHADRSAPMPSKPCSRNRRPAVATTVRRFSSAWARVTLKGGFPAGTVPMIWRIVIYPRSCRKGANERRQWPSHAGAIRRALVPSPGARRRTESSATRRPCVRTESPDLAPHRHRRLHRAYRAESPCTSGSSTRSSCERLGAHSLRHARLRETFAAHAALDLRRQLSFHCHCVTEAIHLLLLVPLEPFRKQSAPGETAGVARHSWCFRIEMRKRRRRGAPPDGNREDRTRARSALRSSADRRRDQASGRDASPDPRPQAGLRVGTLGAVRGHFARAGR